MFRRDPVCYQLVLVARGREWLSANQRLYWAVRADRVRSWRELAACRAREAKLPRLIRAHIICELNFTDLRRRDPSNWAPTAKACVDGLVDAGVFVDDNHTRVVGPDMRMGLKVPAAERGVRLLIFPEEQP